MFVISNISHKICRTEYVFHEMFYILAGSPVAKVVGICNVYHIAGYPARGLICDV